MLKSFSEFKFFQSFRIPVEARDDLRFMVQMDDEFGTSHYIDDAKLLDISVTGLGLSTTKRISVDTELNISLQFKKLHLDLTGRVVRAFSESFDDEKIIYGVELDEEKKIFNFLEKYILSFSSERLKDCLIDSALTENYTKASEGFEIFSLLLSLFKDINNFGNKEGFIDSMMEEVVRILNAQRASIFLINPDSNELEAISAIGLRKDDLKFDYRLGIAGSVFTTGIALNIDTVNDKSRFNDEFDKKYGFETKSIICYPIHNRHDKIIGVIEVLNKRNQDRFTVEDEKTMKVLTLVFSSVFHTFNPVSERSRIRRFSKPFDRKNALIGKNSHIGSLRRNIVKLKDIDCPVLLSGERGVGKTLYAKILHSEGQRGLSRMEVVDCATQNFDRLESEILRPGPGNLLSACQGGTILLRNVDKLSFEFQERLAHIIQNSGFDKDTMTLDVRFMATTTRSLGELVDGGLFDKFLCDYLSKAQIELEPLRRRKDDLPALVDYFLKVECHKEGFLHKSFTSEIMEKLTEYDWPGNVSELRTCIERAVLYNPKEHVITDVDLNDSAAPLVDSEFKKRLFGSVPYVDDSAICLKDRVALIEREMIFAEIKRLNGNKSKAAKEMGISREALRKKLKASEEVLSRLEAKIETKEAA